MSALLKLPSSLPSQLDLFGNNAKYSNRFIAMDTVDLDQLQLFSTLLHFDVDTVVDFRPLMSYPHPKFNVHEVADFYTEHRISIFHAGRILKSYKGFAAEKDRIRRYLQGRNGKSLMLIFGSDTAGVDLKNSFQNALERHYGFIQSLPAAGIRARKL